MKDRGEPPFPRYERKGNCNRCGVCCLNENCEHFEFNEEMGIATCKIYGSSNRPLMCLLFPDMPPILFEGCGYYFIDLWEDNREIRPGDGLR